MTDRQQMKLSTGLGSHNYLSSLDTPLTTGSNYILAKGQASDHLVVWADIDTTITDTKTTEPDYRNNFTQSFPEP